MRSGTGPALVCLAVVAVALSGPALAAGGDRASVAAVAPNATTGEASALNETAAVAFASVAAEGEGFSGSVRVEYRVRSAGGEWARTAPRNVSAERSDSAVWRFEWTLAGLEPATTYEYRVVAESSNGTDLGAVRTFATNESEGERLLTRTPTLPPCPQYRGAGMLCTTTPATTPDGRAIPDDGPAGTTPPARAESPDDWLAGLLPLLSWVAVVAVVAPVVLGGLLWIDSLRGGDRT